MNQLFNAAVKVTGQHGLAADFENTCGTADTNDMDAILSEGILAMGADNKRMRACLEAVKNVLLNFQPDFKIPSAVFLIDMALKPNTTNNQPSTLSQNSKTEA